MLDFKNFLQQNNIEYREYGKNVARGNINISCPFCAKDPGFHLGINLNSNVWGCWRDREHRSKSPIRLLQKLINCSYSEAQNICGISTFKVDSFLDYVPFENEDQVREEYAMEELLDTKNFTGKYSQTRFISYLLGRGYTLNVACGIIDKYDIRYCYKGKLENRLVIPLYQNKQIVNYVARSIVEDTVRFLTAVNPPEDSKTTNLLFDYDNLKKGNDMLFICEGIFDALKVMHILQKPATCIFTKSMSEMQEQKLYELSKYYNKLFILFDKTESLNALKLESKLSYIKNIKNVSYLLEAKDPGDMSFRQGKRLLKNCLIF